MLYKATFPSAELNRLPQTTELLSLILGSGYDRIILSKMNGNVRKTTE